MGKDSKSWFEDIEAALALPDGSERDRYEQAGRAVIRLSSAPIGPTTKHSLSGSGASASSAIVPPSKKAMMAILGC
jgi:hypothetical protein